MGSTQVAMCVVATGTVAAGSYRSLQLDTLAGQNQEVKEALVTMQPGTAMLFPVVASIALLTLFYFVGDIGVIIISLTCFSNGCAIAFSLQPCFAWFTGSENRGGAIGLVCAVLCVGGWLLTGHWLYNNGVTLKGTLLTTTVMGVCACTMAVSLIRLPNSKVATLLFSLLFVYDAFWVFASEPLFGSNVMVSVATSEPRNPLHFVISGLLHINTTIPETLDLPAKLILPDLSKPSGLGDIALPGLLAALSLRLDVKRGRRAGVAFGATMAGYAVGIVLAMLAVYIFRVAQPALIYLVPGVLLPLHYVAWTRGFLMELWNGNTDTAYPEPKKSEDPDQVELETAPLV